VFRSVYTKTLWERRSSIVWWLVATLLLGAWLVAFYPAIRDSEQLQRFIEDFPPELLSLFGIDPAIYTTGFGYLQAQLYSLIGPLLIIGVTVSAGASATAKEEEDGTIDTLLGAPLRRTRLLLEKLAAMATLAAAVALVLALVLVMANPIVDLKLSTLGIVGINLGLVLLGVFFGAVAIAVGAWRGRRSVASAAAGALAIAAWFANGFAPLIDWLDTVNRFLPFHWYLAGDPLLNGPTAWHLLLAAVTAGAVVLGVIAFRTRDLRSHEPLIRMRIRRRPHEESGRIEPAATDGLLRSVYGKTLWERRRSIWGWIIGLGALAALTAAFWPTLQSSGDAMQGLLDAVPRELLAMFGITDPASLTTAEGFLSARLYSSVGSIALLTFAIGAGAGALAGEERKRTMDLLLGTPTRRRRVARDKLAGIVTLVVLIAASLTVVVIIAGAAYDMGLSVPFTITANTGLALLALFYGTMALFVGALTGKPGLASGLAAGLAVAAFILNGFGAAIDGIEPFRWLSPFFWYLQDSPPLARGFSPSYWLLVAGTLAFGLVAVPAFRRRDISS
jgi:ABC-2 type transport system permease protein